MRFSMKNILIASAALVLLISLTAGMMLADEGIYIKDGRKALAQMTGQGSKRGVIRVSQYDTLLHDRRRLCYFLHDDSPETFEGIAGFLEYVCGYDYSGKDKNTIRPQAVYAVRITADLDVGPGYVEIPLHVSEDFSCFGIPAGYSRKRTDMEEFQVMNYYPVKDPQVKERLKEILAKNRLNALPGGDR